MIYFSIFLLSFICLCQSLKFFKKQWDARIITSNANAQQSLRLFSTEDDVDLKELLEKMKKEDSEWLQSVLGDSLDDIISKMDPQDEIKLKEQPSIETNIKDITTAVESSTSVKEIANPNIDLTAPVSKAPTKERFSPKVIAQLKSLGYSDADINTLKSTVVELVLTNQVERPEGNLPKQWIRSTSAESSIPTKTEKLTKPSSLNNRQSIPKKAESKAPVRLSSPNYQNPRNNEQQWGKGKGNEVRWKGAPLNEDELAAMEKYKRNKRSSVVQMQDFDDDDDDYRPSDLKDENNYSEETELSFWPSVEEFKELLLDESRFRIHLVGDWLAPLLREENRVRLEVYEAWMGFVDEGFSDAFDVVDTDELESETVDDDYEDEDDYRNNFDSVRRRYYDQNKLKKPLNMNVSKRSGGVQRSNMKERNERSLRSEAEERKSARAYEEYINKIQQENDNIFIAEEKRQRDLERQRNLIKNKQKPRGRYYDKRVVLPINKEVWFKPDPIEDYEEEEDNWENNLKNSRRYKQSDSVVQDLDLGMKINSNQDFSDRARRRPRRRAVNPVRRREEVEDDEFYGEENLSEEEFKKAWEISASRQPLGEFPGAKNPAELREEMKINKTRENQENQSICNESKDIRSDGNNSDEINNKIQADGIENEKSIEAINDNKINEFEINENEKSL